jgi:hypothetical protein
MRADRPLSYDEDALKNLIRALVKPKDPFELPKARTPAISNFHIT